MEQYHQIKQAYLQTPWRRQLQVIVAFLLVVVSIAVVAGIYLNVTATTATLGRKIQDMKVNMVGYYGIDDGLVTNMETETLIPIEELAIHIASLQLELAHVSSLEAMMERAQEKGFQPVDPYDVLYLEVPGYQGRQTAFLAPASEPVPAARPIIAAMYTESLLDWLAQRIGRLSDSLVQEARP